jgi:hypothetical protein
MTGMKFPMILALVSAAIPHLLGSELKSVNRPEEDDPRKVEVLTKAGIAASAKVRKQEFLRDGIQVAALVTSVVTVGGKVQTTNAIEFWIDPDNRIWINLDDPETFDSRTKIEVEVTSTPDSITVHAPDRKYYEVFFKKSREFLGDATRDMMAEKSLELHLERLRKRRATPR